MLRLAGQQPPREAALPGQRGSPPSLVQAALQRHSLIGAQAGPGSGRQRTPAAVGVVSGHPTFPGSHFRREVPDPARPSAVLVPRVSPRDASAIQNHDGQLIGAHASVQEESSGEG